MLRGLLTRDMASAWPERQLRPCGGCGRQSNRIGVLRVRISIEDVSTGFNRAPYAE